MTQKKSGRVLVSIGADHSVYGVAVDSVTSGRPGEGMTLHGDVSKKEMMK